MGKFFAVILVLVAVLSAYPIIANYFPLPVDISTHGHLIDSQLHDTMLEAGVAFIGAQLMLAYFLFAFTGRKPDAPLKNFPGGAKAMVIAAFLIVGTEVLALGAFGQKAWATVYFVPPKADALQIQAQAEQFAFYFRYPGPDGKYGATNATLMDPSAGGEAAVGLDTSDPAAKDDVVTGTMFLPVNREVDLSIRSVDVIHSFFVPSLRFKQDAVPGLNIHMHFTPNQIGDYEIACAELCGLGHYKMHGMVKVVSQEDFDKWLAAREAEKQ